MKYIYFSCLLHLIRTLTDTISVIGKLSLNWSHHLGFLSVFHAFTFHFRFSLPYSHKQCYIKTPRKWSSSCLKTPLVEGKAWRRPMSSKCFLLLLLPQVLSKPLSTSTTTTKVEVMWKVEVAYFNFTALLISSNFLLLTNLQLHTALYYPSLRLSVL